MTIDPTNRLQILGTRFFSTPTYRAVTLMRVGGKKYVQWDQIAPYPPGHKAFITSNPSEIDRLWNSGMTQQETTDSILVGQAFGL